MKRGLVFTLCAVALAAYSTNAQAQAPTVSLSLNLRYTHPGDPAQGGTWQLVAETDSTIGIAGISAYISNISTTGIVYGNGGSITAATLGAITDGGLPYFGTFGGAVNIVYGQDTASGPIVGNVGRGDAVVNAPGELANDPLFNSTWNGASLIASGTFPGGGNAGNQFNRPAFVTAGINTTDANTLSGTSVPANASIDATTTTTVRGDSVKTFMLEDAGGVEGLSWGDANRDFFVGTDDFNAVFNNFFTGGHTWDEGDVGQGPPAADGFVGTEDFNSVFNNFFTAQTPPSVGAVPEPATAALAAMGLAGALLVRRRK